MATHTAQILIGRGHPNDGGMAGSLQHNPVLLLSENSRPGWVLRPGDWFRANGDSSFRAATKYVLIPSLENTLDDGIALMALILLHDLPWSEPVKAVQAQLIEERRLEMYTLDEDLRSLLLEEVREKSEAYPKFVLSVFQRDSLVFNKISALKKYANEMAVCMPVFNRDRNRWAGAPQESGSLDQEVEWS